MGFPWFKKKERVDIGQLHGIPLVIQKLNGTVQYGPNCWNATIIYFDPSEPVRFTSPSEMIEWLKSKTILDSGKFCATGSILALYGDDGLTHTAVYVGPGILWHKRGCSGQYEFVTERQLRAIYFEANRFEYRIAI